VHTYWIDGRVDVLLVENRVIQGRRYSR